MERFCTNLFVIATSLALLAFTESVLASQSYDYKPYENHQAANNYPASTKPLSQSNPTCRKFLQLCTTYGDYDCCEGFSCTGFSPDLPTGVGVCTHIGGPPTKDTCQKKHQLCQPYGPYNCCAGSRCVHPRTLTPVEGIKPEKMMLPPGVGICEDIALLPPPKGPVQKCQGPGNICAKEGPYSCCKGECKIDEGVIGICPVVY